MNLANLAPQPQISSNDSSNLSSDKELEIVLINTTKGGGGSSSSQPFAEIKGHGRKRKRLEFKSEATPRPGEHKNDRKITDYIRVKTSPKRPNVNFPNTNGNSLSNDGVQLTPLCTSPIQCFQQNNQNQQQQQLQHQIAVATKPSNQNITAYSSTSSDSNQSPPSNNTKTERGVQTSEILIVDHQMEMGTGKSAAAVVDEKKTNTNASEVEALMRANAELKQTNSELKQTLERKVQASKETIMRLLIEQSRMQRKQSLFECGKEEMRCTICRAGIAALRHQKKDGGKQQQKCEEMHSSNQPANNANVLPTCWRRHWRNASYRKRTTGGD